MPNMWNRLRDWLIDPRVRDLDADGTDFSIAHRSILLRKRMLRELFRKFYAECRAADLRYFGSCKGMQLEIGSGSSIIKEFYPEVITSDIKPLPFVDLVLNAHHFPFRDESLRAVYGINVFHHIASPRSFFLELRRVLQPGGGAVLIEPYHGPCARWLFRHLHKTETYDMGAPGWEADAAAGSSTKANQALSYVVFTRDRARFEVAFPDLRILSQKPHTHLWYLASGGVNFRQLAPTWTTPLIRGVEFLLRPFNRWLALQHLIVLRKGEATRGASAPPEHQA